MTELEFRERLLSWFRENKRDLPWRREVSPYRTWISEIMLQQTRVSAVIDYFLRFTEELPTVEELAAVPDEKLLKLWQGLGYYSRARNLKKAAQTIVSEYGGEIPSDESALRALSGIGSYTAGAIASIAYGKRVPAVDGNVLRVYARIFGDERDVTLPATKKAFEAAVLSLMPGENAGLFGRNDCGAFNEGLIELGATVCLPNGAPLCSSCPFLDACVARREGKIDALPVRGKKMKRKIEERTVLLLSDGERYALVKRPEKGLLASLFEFVNLEGKMNEREIQDWLSERGASAVEITKIGEAKHIFTHIEWHMTGYFVRFTGEIGLDAIFASPAEIQKEYAVPSAFRFFLRYIEGNGRERNKK